MAMTTSAERKFINLRKRLDQLGYRQPLAIECLPLVEKLFSDLVHTTESLRNAKLAAGKTEKDSRNLDTILEPYKTDNARLVKENNELHLGLLKVKEEKDRISRELKAYIRKLEHETTDLKFLNNQYVHKVRTLEKDSKAKTERIFQLQEKNMQAVVQTPGGKKRSIPFRRQRLQTDELLPPSGPAPSSVAQPDDPYIADLLQVADDRIQELQNEVAQLKLDLERAQAGIKHLNNQVEERDKEIERLNRALDGGRPNDVISLEAQNISNEKLIAHLNLQIEYLQETNRSLEEKVEGLQQRKKTVSSEVADLSTRNQELCQELTQIDQLAQQLEKDKEMVLETADMELQEAKKEIQRQLREMGNLEEVISTLRRDMADGDHEKDRLRDQLLELQEQNEKMEGLMNFLEEEKKRLQDKTERMTQADKEMILELERMRVKHGVCGKDPSPSRLDAFVKSLEEERDYYRQEVERYRTVKGRVNKSPTPSPGRGRSPRGRSSWHGQRDFADAELSRAVKERDELQSVLLGFEKHMEDIQTRVKLLTAERDQLSTQYQQAQEELRRVYMELESPELQSRIRDDRTQTELQRITAERDRLKGAQTTALTDREQEEISILELENTVQMMEREKADLRTQVSVLKESRAAVEKELQARSTIMVQNAEEAVQQRAESCALRLLQEQMEQSLSDVQHRLSVKTNELHAAHQQIDKLEEKIAELSGHGSSQKDEVTALQNAIASLDREKDALQDAVDQKTERMVLLQEESHRKEKTLVEVRLTITDLENSLDQLKGALNSREREIASLRRQLDQSHEELSSVSRDREVVLRENRRLQDDLATMTRENQAVHAEMQDALNERDELKLRVHSYISEVARIESLMAAKEQENREMLEHFRSIHSESEDMELKLQQAEGLNKSIRLELLSSDTERRHLRERVSLQDREIQEHLNAMQAYEAQVSSLARAMSHLEEEVQTAQTEKASVLEDLASIRELCVKLDSSKEVTVRQLTAKSMELERVTGELEDVRSEVELLKKQLASERLTVRNLEALLSTNRQKEFQTHLSASEKESELKVLRDRLALADSKTAGHAREVSQLRGKVSQLQTEMDVLKRQLTTERFERERAVQEMRRQGLSFSSLRSSSPLSTSLSPRPVSPERSILRTPEHSIDKIPEKSVSFKD
ncbi:centrosomal protein of 135 kDa isoform X1 [Triplophysa rosa]|uniref:Centrosomal protein of 135 kDa n=2 Tax=Triplophysa rosa TaxID=992332 RepID=A0A9W7TLI1_TRIRA|nr:centrosomal protein of 135 kDa isoform X1 [Triplophysa rosa]XP_057209775.1 centrosomal protein of 135 kDa isoform X1 [Triplophysa rosa]KAI7799400.1 putative centrosomal protein of 135 kDa [Triplophysa rosa]